MSGAGLTRRSFLQVVGAGGAGLLMAIYLPHRLLADPSDTGGENTAFTPSVFLRIDPDGTVTVVTGRCELGQGAHTAMAMLIAEELEADWSRVRVEQAPAHPTLYGSMTTGGSSSVRGGWNRLRQAGAAAREMLIAAAAATWGLPASECRAEQGWVIHTGGRRLGYGDLAAAAAKQPLPSDPPLKAARDFRLIGHGAPRLDMEAKANGSAKFGLDVRRPGQLTAAVARCPVFGGKAKSWNEAAARAVPGVRAVFSVPSGVAVVADSTWAALQGREALAVVWDEGAEAALDGAEIARRFAALAEQEGKTARDDGDFATAFAGAARRLEAVYEQPYLAHAALEPGNCTAHVTRDGVEIWAPTQGPQWAQSAAAEAAGVPIEKVLLHTTWSGGAFGRRLMPDFVVEAVEVAKHVTGPVQVVWTRADDLAHDFHRPASHHRLAAGLDGDGRLIAWRHRIVSQSIGAQHFGQGAYDDEPDAVDGAKQWPYQVPNVRVEHVLATLPVPIGWWRSVYNTQNAFVNECFLDECAAAAGVDPLAWRLGLLPAGDRLRGVLERAASAAGWGGPVPAGRARGLAAHACFGSFVAHVAEVSLSGSGGIVVHRLTCAVDCGVAVDPGGIRAQVDGSVALALSAVLFGEITLEKGRVRQRNYDDYPVLTNDRMPEIDVHIIANGDPVGGIGEPPLPPVAPAVANALFALTGRRVRRLPIRPADLRG